MREECRSEVVRRVRFDLTPSESEGSVASKDGEDLGGGGGGDGGSGSSCWEDEERSFALSCEGRDARLTGSRVGHGS